MKDTYHPGYDYFTPDPGEWGTKKCPICGKLMEVRRNVYGTTSYVESLTGSKRSHDVFYCKDAFEPWHVKIIELELLKKKNAASKKFIDLINQEIVEIKKEHNYD